MKMRTMSISMSGYSFTPYLLYHNGHHSLCSQPKNDWSIDKLKSLGKSYSIFKISMWPHTQTKNLMRQYGYSFRPGKGMRKKGKNIS